MQKCAYIILQIIISFFLSNSVILWGQSDGKTQSFVVKKDQPLSIINSYVKDMEAWKKYFELAMPIAGPAGFKELLVQDLIEVKGTKYTASEYGAVGFYSLNSKKAFLEDMVKHPKWTEITALRSDAWHEIQQIMVFPEEDIKLDFHNNHIYEYVVIWGKEDEAMRKIGGIIDKELSNSGGYIVAKFKPGYYEKTPGKKAPDLVIMKGWASDTDRQKYLNAMKSHESLLKKAIQESEVFVIMNRIKQEKK